MDKPPRQGRRHEQQAAGGARLIDDHQNHQNEEKSPVRVRKGSRAGSAVGQAIDDLHELVVESQRSRSASENPSDPKAKKERSQEQRAASSKFIKGVLNREKG